MVEPSDALVSVCYGDKLERLHRITIRPDPIEGARFTPDGRYAFVASRDGWISKIDLWNLTLVAEVRAGKSMRDFAISSDGTFLAVTDMQDRTLVLFDADLQLRKLHAIRSKDGKTSAVVSAIYDAAPRRSFVAVLEDVPELWEISHDPLAEDVPVGTIHDFRYKEGAFEG